MTMTRQLDWKLKRAKARQGPVLREVVPSAAPLTARQRQLLAFLWDFIATKGFAPNYGEMGEALDIVSPNGVKSIIDPLVAKGYVAVLEGQPRGIRLVGAALSLAYEDTPAGGRLREALGGTPKEGA